MNVFFSTYRSINFSDLGIWCESVVDVIPFIFTFSYTKYRESIVILQKIEIKRFSQILHLPDSEKHSFAILSVCLCVSLCVCL